MQSLALCQSDAGTFTECPHQFGRQISTLHEDSARRPDQSQARMYVLRLSTSVLQALTL
jgi:hypothetical protein